MKQSASKGLPPKVTKDDLKKMNPRKAMSYKGSAVMKKSGRGR